MTDQQHDPPVAPSPPHGSSSADLDKRLLRVAGFFSPRPRRLLPAIPGNDVRLLVNGDEVYAAMLAAILAAKHSVDIEMYIWHADTIGRRFAALLRAKAAEGVAIRVIYDSFGCLTTPLGFWGRMRAAGVQVAEFNPLSFWRRRRGGNWFHRRLGMNNRDHRKIILVDGQVAFIGGANIGNEYLGRAQDVRHWRDTCVQVRGPVVSRCAAMFSRQWQRLTGQATDRRAVPPLMPAGSDLAILIDCRPGWRNMIQRMMLVGIRRARRRIEITMAYFTPPARILRALRRAARRGVQVTLILPANSDVRAIYYTGRSHYAGLLRAGVRIFECLGTVLHAKTMQVDDLWATVGSANLDLRSYRLNEEANLFVVGRPFADQLTRAFRADLARSREITLEQWKRRPRTERAREWFYRLFRAWM